MSRNLHIWRTLLLRGVSFQRIPQCASQVCTKPSVQEDMEQLLKNPYYIKYADKFQKLKDSNPEAFMAKLKELEKAYQQNEAEAAAEKEAAAASACDASRGQTKSKTLDSILKLDLIKDKTKEEIETIWQEYHRDKDCVFASIPAEEYDEMQKHLKEFPSFLYPVPRDQGYIFYYQQFSDNSVHFTPLLMYQSHGENAPICLTLEHYTELKQSKGIVLMRGKPDLKVISAHEAQLLAFQVKIYYGLHSALKFNLVRLFNNSPANFNHMDLVKEFENYKKDSRQVKDERKS